MNNFKTLKDLKIVDWDSPEGTNSNDYKWIQMKELKAEAVKWVKGCDKDKIEQEEAINKEFDWRQAFLNFFNFSKQDFENE